MHYLITAESESERILKIGQHFPKLWASIKLRVFYVQLYVIGNDADRLAISTNVTAVQCTPCSELRTPYLMAHNFGKC